MNIGIIRGSAKKEGQTQNIANFLEKDLKEKYSDINILNIDLSVEHINIENGDLSVFLDGTTSVQNDSLNNCKKKLLDSDGIIIVSPVYLHHIPGVFKNFLDRISNMAHFFALHHKLFSVIVHANSNGTDQTVAYIEKIFSSMGAHHSNSTSFMAIDDYSNLENKLISLNRKIISDIEKNIYPTMSVQNRLFNTIKEIILEEENQGIITYKNKQWSELRKYNSYSEFIKYSK